MKITLYSGDEEKTFISPFISSRKIKKAMALENKLNNVEDFTEDLIDEIAEFLVDIYGNQFTIDDLLDGLPSHQFFEKIRSDMSEMIGDFSDAVKN